MRPFAAFVGAAGLWALPAAAAAPLHLAPPVLSTRAVECSKLERARCESVGQRALDSDLSCETCAPMPADIMQPPPAAATPRSRSLPCLPRADGKPPPLDCSDVPRLDAIPRP